MYLGVNESTGSGEGQVRFTGWISAMLAVERAAGMLKTTPAPVDEEPVDSGNDSGFDYDNPPEPPDYDSPRGGAFSVDRGFKRYMMGAWMLRRG